MADLALLPSFDDLKAATAQKAAMAKAKVPLVNATETAVKANAGSQAVSIYPQLRNGDADWSEKCVERLHAGWPPMAA